MRTSEWVAIGYFIYLFACGAARRAPLRAMRLVVAISLLTTALIVLLARFDSSAVALLLRDWLPGAYVMLGYWTTGLLYPGANPLLEDRLRAVDAYAFRRLGPAVLRMPRIVLECLEVAYLLCYPLVPAGLAVLYLAGHRAHADAYWTAVLASAFAAYGVLPWAGTRPPRAIGSEPWIDRRRVAMHRVNLRVLEHGSIQVNTFPSGHAAAAWAVALSLAGVPGPAWLVFGAMAAAIGAAAVVGRYHYLLDVVAGVTVAVVMVTVLG